MPEGETSTASAPMRERIMQVAGELLVQHGCRGLRFADIAARLETTRATVHYHFGNKKHLIEEVVEAYVHGTLVRFRAIWETPGAALMQRIEQTIAFNHERYRRFNPDGKGAKAWSMIARMRLERDLLSPSARAALDHFGAELDAMVSRAVAAARDAGELVPDAPVGDIARQLVAIANSSGSITVDAGTFDVLEHLYLGFARIVAHAYGTDAPTTGDRSRLVDVH